MRLGEPKKVCFVWCAYGLCFGFFSFASPYIFYTLRLDQFFFHFRLKMKYLMRVNHDFRIINFICVFFSSFSFYLFCASVRLCMFVVNTTFFHNFPWLLFCQPFLIWLFLYVTHIIRAFLHFPACFFFYLNERNWTESSWKIDFVNYPFD